MEHPYDLTVQLERREELDQLVDALDKRIPAGLREGPLRDALDGTWLGHALHPPLTDVTLGTWMSATLLDLVGPPRWQPASTALIGIGLIAAVPTVASGMVEWQDTPDQRRVGAAHAVINSVGASLYLASFVAKLSGRRSLGVGAAIAGGLVASVGGYLGGHLAFARGVGVDQSRNPHRERARDRVEVTFDRPVQEQPSSRQTGD